VTKKQGNKTTEALLAGWLAATMLLIIHHYSYNLDHSIR